MIALALSASWLLAAVVSIFVGAAGDEPGTWLDFLTKGGLLAGSLLIVWALLTDRLVAGPRYRREIQVRDRELELWREAARQSSRSLERVAGVIFPAAGPPEKPSP